MGHRPFARVAYITEYGREPDEQSALNLITYLSPDTSHGYRTSLGQATNRSGSKVEAANYQTLYSPPSKARLRFTPIIAWKKLKTAASI